MVNQMADSGSLGVSLKAFWFLLMTCGNGNKSRYLDWEDICEQYSRDTHIFFASVEACFQVKFHFKNSNLAIQEKL